MIKKQRLTPAKGVGISIVSDNRFKNECLSLSFMTKLNSKENALAFALPSLLLRGSQKYPSSYELGQALQATYDTELGGESFRRGNAKIIRFSVSFISDDYTDTPITEKVLSILKEAILNPLLTPDGCLSEKFTELEKSSILDLIKSSVNNRRSYAFSKCRETLLKGDDCGVSKYGTADDVNALTSKALTEFYHRMLKDFALEIFYEGSLDPNYISCLITSTFGKIIEDKKESISQLGAYLPPPTIEYSETVEDSDSEQTILCMGFETPHLDSMDYTPTLFTEILSNSSVSRLFMNIREAYGLCYFCDYNNISKKDRAIICAGLEYNKVSMAKEAILGEIEDLARGNISDYELEAARSSLINGYCGVFDSQLSVENWEISSLLLGKYLSPEDVIAKIEKIDAAAIADYASKLKLSCVYILKEGCQ
ncbi:MAG: insulinase family protein [Ruminococcaceae bacterium]|nr:insulinase family protein [Oscillospiraceae bacterium]